MKMRIVDQFLINRNMLFPHVCHRREYYYFIINNSQFTKGEPVINITIRRLLLFFFYVENAPSLLVIKLSNTKH